MLERLFKSLSSTEYDLIAVTGDIECDSEAVEILKSQNKPVLFVPGNMDDIGVLKTFKQHEMSIDAEMREIGGFAFCGIGGLSFVSSLNTITSKLKGRKSELEGRLVVLSHFPPRAERVDVVTTGLHAGLKELRDFILEYRPLAFLHGHIHESPGSEVIGNTLVVNAGPLRKRCYAIVDLKLRVAENRLLK